MEDFFNFPLDIYHCPRSQVSFFKIKFRHNVGRMFLSHPLLQIISFCFVKCQDFVEFTNVTEDKSHIPNAINVAPKYHDKGTISPKNIIPYIACLLHHIYL